MNMVVSIKKMKKVSSLLASLLILAGFLLLAHKAEAADTSNLSISIRGLVKRGISVVVSGVDLETAIEKKTSASGAVTFKGLQPGTYEVTPRRNGLKFSPGVKSITLVANKNQRVRFTGKVLEGKVGMAYCISCHKKVSADVYADWLAGPHGNFNYVDVSHHEYDYGDFTTSFSYPADHTKFTGFPNEATIKESLKSPSMAGKTKAYCLNCHGPSSSDNSKIATFPLVRPEGIVDTVNDSVQISRPVIGCEACHGSGRTHISRPKKSVAFTDPTSVQCGQCHNKNFPVGHLTYHPMGAAGTNNPGIFEAYQASPHTHSLDDAELFTDSKKTALKPLCAKCHSDQGARIFKSTEGDASTLPAKFDGEANHTEFDAVQCRTCHYAHDPSKLLENASAATGTATARSAEFNTCTNCHQLLDSSDHKIDPYHNDHDKSITNTHYDNPNTAAFAATPPAVYTPATAFEGYTVNRGSDTACSDCHNPHIAGTKINKQWAESAHGDLAGEGWIHYNWKATDRQACQRCHSPTGFANIVEDQLNYLPANNNFSHLTGGQNETLTCKGCHSDSAFNRREVGAFEGKVEFPYHEKLRTTPTPAAMPTNSMHPTEGLVALEDDSNLCLFCHMGRESKATLDYKFYAPTPVPPATPSYQGSFTNIHYLAAAASFFGSETHGGYEYNGKTYVTRSTFPDHPNNTFNTCVKCHMRKESTDSPDHRFLPQVSDCAGANCHVGITEFTDIRPASALDYDGDSNTTEGMAGEIATLRDALYARIRTYASGTLGFAISYDPAPNPYFFRDPNNNGVHDTGENTGYNKFDPKLLKACYNYQQVVKEPNGWVHNGKYLVELLYDSLEDLGADMTPYTRP